MSPKPQYIPAKANSLEEEVEDIKRYLQILSRKYTTISDTSRQVIDELYRAITEDREDYNNAELRKLWNEIEKNTGKSISYALSGQYLRKTDFGQYFENATVMIDGTPVGITQLYDYSAGITSDAGDITITAHNKILTGLLYYENNIPKYGVGVGELTTVTDSGGHTVLDRSGLLGTFTADELAFWKNNSKVMYINTSEGLVMPAGAGRIGDLNIKQLSSGSVGLVWEQTTPSHEDAIFAKDKIYFRRGIQYFEVGEDSTAMTFKVVYPNTTWLEMDYIDGGTLGGHWDIEGYVSDSGTAYQAASIPFGAVDSTSTSTKFTATVPGITELRDGVCMILYNGVVTSASGFTININDLGEKPCYSNMAMGNPVTPTNPTRDTTIFNINYAFLFVYSENLVSGGCWIGYRGYDANTNTIGYQIRTNYTSMATTDKFYRYRLLFTSADGTKWVPANTSTSTNATAVRTPNTRAIDPFGEIAWYGTTTAIDSGAVVTPAQLWQQYYGTYTNIGYSFNNTGAAQTMTANLPIYIKCTPQADGSAIIDANQPYTQTLPSSADGKIYIYLGRAYSATNFEITMKHPVYYYHNGGIRLWTGE